MLKTKNHFYLVLASWGLKLLIVPALIISIISLLARELWPPLQVFFPFMALSLLIVFSLALGVVAEIEFGLLGAKIICFLFIVVALAALAAHFLFPCLSAFSVYLALIVPFYIYMGVVFGQIFKKI